MGVVYRAHDAELDRLVALKFLPPDIEASKTEVDRFIHEAKSASSLDHPNICTIYDIGRTTEGRLFIAMALYEGETVREKLRRGPLPEPEAVDIATQILSGLGCAHAKHIIHRDIKPGNIMVTSGGLVKILDFGVAKLSSATVAETETIAGTLAYMAPEQLDGGSGPGADIWSTGVCLYEMLTAQLPFRGETTSAVINAILNGQPRNLRTHNANLPFDLDRVIARALEKDPQLRYHAAGEMSAELRHVHAGHLSETMVQSPFTAVQALPSPREQPSIAVLPFTNLSPDDEHEYFSEGLAEELIHALSQIKELRVVSRTSAFRFKERAQDVREIARNLGVETILEGSVRRSGNRIRVTVLLTNAADGYNVWSQRFDREIGDIFAVQDEIAGSVAKLLVRHLTHTGPLEIGRKMTGNVEAWNLYLKGRFQWNKATEEAYRKAQKFFQQAIETDPECAPAYAGLADFYRSLAFWGFADPRVAWPAARQYALKALELDPNLPQVHITMARYHQQMEWNRDAAEGEFRRAVDLNPSYSEAHQALAVFLLQARRFDEALAGFQLARDLDPLNLAPATAVAWLHYYSGDYDQAAAECRKVLDIEPGYFEALCCMAMISELSQDFAAAESWWQRGWIASGKSAIVAGFVGRFYAVLGNREKTAEFVSYLEDLRHKRYVSPITYAFIYTGMGHLDSAVENVQKAFDEHDSFLSYADVFPPFAPLKGQPRFVEILSKIGLRKANGASV